MGAEGSGLWWGRWRIGGGVALLSLRRRGNGVRGRGKGALLIVGMVGVCIRCEDVGRWHWVRLGVALLILNRGNRVVGIVVSRVVG